MGLVNKHYKKIAPLALSALLLSTTAVLANESVQPTAESEQQMNETFTKITGTVTGTEKRDYGTYYVVGEGDNTYGFVVTDETVVFTNEGTRAEVKEGDRVSLYIYSNAPMILIYPPQYSPAVVIVETDSISSATVGHFDKNHLDENKQLKLTIHEQTILEDMHGNKIESFDGGNAVVFSTIFTASIPAQTPVVKLVQIRELADYENMYSAADEILDFVGNDVKYVNDVAMVPLRKVAENYGYKVASTGKGAIVSKGALSYTITRDTKTYGYNRALRQFNVAPALLEKNKTYVELDFAAELID